MIVAPQARSSARELLGPTGPFAQALKRYESREPQLQMTDAVESALTHGGVLLVEAGTGTGKTLAYLVPALLSGKRVVISTGTRALQDQLMQHDVPLLERVFGIEGQIVCLKGLSNYLCKRRYEEFRGSPDSMSPHLSKRLPVLSRWKESTAIGDRAELETFTDDDPLWAHVASGSDTRIGPKCTYYDECFVTQARKRAEAAQIVIVNHHLFFADLATRHPGGGGFLPPYDAVIFDEAHQVEDVVTEFFGTRVSTTRVETMLRDAQKTFLHAKLDRESSPHSKAVLDAAARFFTMLPRTASNDAARLPLTPGELSEELVQAHRNFDGALDGLDAFAKLNAQENEAISQVARRVHQLRDDLASILDKGDRTRVMWTETRGRLVSIGASPIDVDAIVREQVIDHTPSVIFASATLSTGGSFDFVKQRFGIDHEVDELIVPSPFAYETQAALYLPSLPDPRSPEYFDAAAEEALALLQITGGGAFVLCTSHRAMNELKKRIESRTKLRVLCQGEAPKATLLENFRQDGHAVLIATSSFWEGIDVPGEALRLVIIDKLPFDVPTDPLVVARCKRVEETGASAFMKLLVPSAAISLKQGFGRLIRTRHDHGIVAIFDARLTTKSYGKVFLKSLPPAKRCRSREEVQAFFVPQAASGSATIAVP